MTAHLHPMRWNEFFLGDGHYIQEPDVIAPYK